MGEPQRHIGEEFDVVLVRMDGETFLFSGDLESCEEWLASNGDTIEAGHFELRPVNAGVDD